MRVAVSYTFVVDIEPPLTTDAVVDAVYEYVLSVDDGLGYPDGIEVLEDGE